MPDSNSGSSKDTAAATTKSAQAKPAAADDDDDDEMTPMDSEEWNVAMKGILDHLDRKGDFCVGRRIELPPYHPKLTIDGIQDENGECERLSFPLPVSQARRIASVAEKAPFGKGLNETVLDEQVRKAWQVDASMVHFADADVWKQSLTGMVRSLCDALGLPDSCQVQANLYKLLLYEPGGHFQRHCDTEKERGMFGTLVLQLPSKHSGGALVIHHGDKTKTMDFSSDSEDACFATAFYADCEHEIQPVTAGWRLCLVYNLVLVQHQAYLESVLTAHCLTKQSRQLQILANQWPNESRGDLVKGYLLEHKYTQTNLHFSNLKGRDKQVVDLLRDARDAEGKPLFVVCLSLLEKTERGSAEPSGGYYRRRGYRYRYYDSDDDSDGGPHTMSEVHEVETDTSHWIGPDDQVLSSTGAAKLGFDPETSLLLDEGEEADDVFGESPDKEDYEGYQGNYGPTLEYWYYRGAVVFWPSSKNGEVAARAGYPFMVSYLRSVTGPEALQVGTKVVELVEKDPRHTVTEHLLDGLLRTNDVPLMLRALHKTSSISSSVFAKTLVNVVLKLNSPQVTAVARQIVHKDSANGNIRYPYELVLQLQDSGKPQAAQAFRDSFVHGFISNAPRTFKPSSMNELILVVAAAYQCPSLFPSFIDSCIAHASPSQAGSILERLARMEGAVTSPHVQKLYKAHLNCLRKATTGGKPSFSWRQPKARFVGKHASSVNAFLHSDEETHRFHGFNGIGHARNWANKYFDSSSVRGYSAKAAVGGRGQDAFVEVTKTRVNYQTELRQYEADVAKMERLMTVFGGSHGPQLDSATTPASKRSTRVAVTQGSSGKRQKRDIQQGDTMIIRGIAARPTLNETSVVVKKRHPNKEGRWIVEVPSLSNSEKQVSIASEKLFHICTEDVKPEVVDLTDG